MRVPIGSLILTIALFLMYTYPLPVQGYVGPGAGFAYQHSLWVVIMVVLVAILGVLFLPARALLRWRRRRKRDTQD